MDDDTVDFDDVADYAVHQDDEDAISLGVAGEEEELQEQEQLREDEQVQVQVQMAEPRQEQTAEQEQVAQATRTSMKAKKSEGLVEKDAVAPPTLAIATARNDTKSRPLDAPKVSQQVQHEPALEQTNPDDGQIKRAQGLSIRGTGKAVQSAKKTSSVPSLAVEPVKSSMTEDELPLHWATRKSRGGETYYVHTLTRETTWDKPVKGSEERVDHIASKGNGNGEAASGAPSSEVSPSTQPVAAPAGLQILGAARKSLGTAQESGERIDAKPDNTKQTTDRKTTRNEDDGPAQSNETNKRRKAGSPPTAVENSGNAFRKRDGRHIDDRAGIHGNKTDDRATDRSSKPRHAEASRADHRGTADRQQEAKARDANSNGQRVRSDLRQGPENEAGNRRVSERGNNSEQKDSDRRTRGPEPASQQEDSSAANTKNAWNKRREREKLNAAENRQRSEWSGNGAQPTRVGGLGDDRTQRNGTPRQPPRDSPLRVQERVPGSPWADVQAHPDSRWMPSPGYGPSRSPLPAHGMPSYFAESHAAYDDYNAARRGEYRNPRFAYDDRAARAVRSPHSPYPYTEARASRDNADQRDDRRAPIRGQRQGEKSDVRAQHTGERQQSIASRQRDMAARRR